VSAFLGAVPINQLNSLPLLSADQLAYGGVVSVIGGAINRYFDPTATGIAGAPGNMSTVDPDVSGTLGVGAYSVISNLLDVRGCSRFTALAAVKMPGVGEDVVYTLNLRIASPVAADTLFSQPPRTGLYGSGAWPQVAAFNLPVSAAGAFPAYKTGGKGWMVGGRDAVAYQTGSLGFIYLWFNFANAGAAKSAVLFVSIYATS
jgi:hypothetical protein